MEGRTDHLHGTQMLRERIEALVAGVGGDGAKLQTIIERLEAFTAGLRGDRVELQTILEGIDVVETELSISANDGEASTSSAVSTKRLKSVAAHEDDEQPEHEDLTRPSMWQNLPRELLPLIFARLPFAATARLQAVSKAWFDSIDTRDSEISRELEVVNHSRLALITPSDCDSCMFEVRFFDVQEMVWHFKIIQPMPYPSCMLGAADGGLMCFVSVGLSDPRLIVVLNPFTMTARTLPSLQKLDDDVLKPTMVHLSVDAKTGKYKVVVAGYTDEDRQQLEVDVYNSDTDQWSKVDSSERIYGYEYDWDEMEEYERFEETRRGPCVCAEGRIEDLLKPHMMKNWPRHSVESVVLMKNRLLVLHKVIRKEAITNGGDVPVYCISEFACNGSACVEVAVHRCDPLDECLQQVMAVHRCEPLDGYIMQEVNFTLHSACGFLMVFADRTWDIGGAPVGYPEIGWLYHVSTKTWSKLPPLPEEYKFEICYHDLLCEVNFNIVP